MMTNFSSSIRIGIDARPALNQRTGVGNYVFNLVRTLSKIGTDEEFNLFSNSFKNEFQIDEFKELQNCTIRHSRYPNVLINLLWGRFGGNLMKTLTKDANLLHFTGHIPKNPGDLPSVATVHDLFNIKFPESVAPEFRVSQQKFARSLKKVKKIIAVSEYTKTDLINFLDTPEEKISVIPHGIDTKSFPPSTGASEINAKIKNRFGGSGEYILCVGTLEPRKNYLKTLEAFKIILKRFPDLKLVIAGGKGWQSDLIHQKTSDLQLDSSVLFPDYVRYSDLPTLYKGAAAFLFPSIYEGFGLPVLEALSFNVPIAVSNVASLPEIAGEAALKFDPNIPEDIAKQIIRLLEDSDLKENLKRLGNERIKQFTWEETARKTLEVYHSLGASP
jgi:glycosyltransferase involved in cell wall biosynthesis